MTQAQSDFGKQRPERLTACGKVIPMAVRGAAARYVNVSCQGWQRYTFALFLLDWRRHGW